MPHYLNSIGMLPSMLLPDSDVTADAYPVNHIENIPAEPPPPREHTLHSTPYEPPFRAGIKTICVKSISIACVNTTTSDPLCNPPPLLDNDLATALRCQLDTGADITCTNILAILHDYRSYSKSFPCKLRLVGAINSKNFVYPLGEGYLHIPSSHQTGYTRVRCIFSPHLTSTLLCEDDLVRSNPSLRLQDFTTAIHKYHDVGSFSLALLHKRLPARSFAVHGIISNGKCYTQPLLMPNLPAHHPRATIYNSFDKAMQSDKTFQRDCLRATVAQIQSYHLWADRQIKHALEHLPEDFSSLPFTQWSHDTVPVHAIKAATERLLWHQRLGHPSDHYLYTAHKFVDGVPQFKHSDPVLDRCPVCIQSKQTKTAAGPNTTRTATRPYQGLSIDFSFSGTHSKDTTRNQLFEGLNGETSWILISDHFSRHLIGATRMSKASPLHWLRQFLETNAPKCPGKYVFMDQGGELYGNPKVRALFLKFGYKIRPTGADNSHQNGPVERAHRTVADKIRCLLSGADLPIKFWPYAFHHALRLINALPGRDQEQSPLHIITGKRENLRHFKTFGSRVWVRPTTRRRGKFKNNSRKGIFLGFVPDTTRNIVWYDVASNRPKIASHATFDEGMNDLPLHALPPNVVHLQRSSNNEPIEKETDELNTDDLHFSVSPFDTLISKQIDVKCNDPLFGLELLEDEINGRAFVHDVKVNSSTSRLYSSRKATRNKIRGAFITSINDIPVFDKASALDALSSIKSSSQPTFRITFAPLAKANRSRLWKEFDEHNLFAPDPTTDNASIDLIAIRAITALRFGLDTSDDILPDDFIHLALNALQSNAITPAEQALGSFTRRKLKTLDNWSDWRDGERKQLDQFHELEMFGRPVYRPPNSVLLRPHWQYSVRRNGDRRSRNCCDGSKRAAPLLHALAKTYSSCVEQPVQRLFIALSSTLDHQLFSADAKDAYAHSPPPERPTYVSIDGAYADWYEWKFNTKIDRSKVLPVQHALQGHPESGRLWEEHINSILSIPELNFKSTVHDKCIYSTVFNTNKVLLLRQVDDFLLSCNDEATAIAIFDIIGNKLRLPNETVVPFKYLGLADDYNGIKITQTKHYNEISCPDYIDRIARTHGWSDPDNDEIQSHPTTPLHERSLDYIYDDPPGPSEGTSEHADLQSTHGFSYRTLLGELLYAYVTCRPDIGFAVTTLSKFSMHPNKRHYRYLKGVATYLRRSKHWGIRYSRPSKSQHKHLPDGDFSDRPKYDHELPVFPPLPTGPTISCFVDAAYANVKTSRRSTTGINIMLANGTIVYKSKTQTQTAQSSTEAEFYAAVAAAKLVRYLRSILSDLGFPQTHPTVILEDNDSTISIVNSGVPTERSRHIDIPYFAIQDWKRDGSIIMQHIPGKINPADAMTKPLGWVLHNRHARRFLGHYPAT